MSKTTNVLFTETEMRLLRKAAAQSCRRPQDQARFFVLKGLGLVTDDGPGAEMNNRRDAQEFSRQSVTAIGA